MNKKSLSGIVWILFAAIAISFCAIAASAAEANFTVTKTIIGNEPLPYNKTVQTKINITNTGEMNITKILTKDYYDATSLTYTGSTPMHNGWDPDNGIINWNSNSLNLGTNQSYTIQVSFTPKKQGIISNNAVANVTLKNSTNITESDIIYFTIGDKYEPDGAYTSAATIPTDGTEQFHTFQNLSSGAPDYDWVKFSAQGGYYYIIKTKQYTSPSITDTYMSLYDSDGTTLLQRDDDEEAGVITTSKIVWKAISTGILYILLEEYLYSSGGNYSISVEKQGKLNLHMDSLNGSSNNITKYESLNVQGRLQCVGGPCRDVSFYLDPKEEAQNNGKLLNSKEINEILNKEGNVNVIVKLKDTQASGFGAKSAEKTRETKDSIKASQEKFLSSAKKFNVKRRFTTVMNGLSGNVDSHGLQELIENENVEAIYYDRPMHAFLSLSVPFINGTRVWQETIDGKNINGTGQAVCVIDTGIRYGHPDFGSCAGVGASCPKVPGGYDFINNDNDPYDDHTSGHGTHVSGIVASLNSTYKGVAPGAKIISIKSLGADGGGPSSTIIAGIDWCVANRTRFNISVISMSLGDASFGTNLPCDYDSMASSINAAVSAGITVVVASGNEYRGYSTLPGISTPACISNAVSVGAVGRNDNTIATYANRDWLLDVVAPGSSITATKYSGGHFAKSGTSMATPHVAGVIALMQQRNMMEYGRLASPDEINARLKTSDIISTDLGYTELSFPRVDAYDAVMQKGIIPNSIGALPFYTNRSNPHDCGNMTSGQNCSVVWWVNATKAGWAWEFFLIGESDVELNVSESAYVNVKEITVLNLSAKPNITVDYPTQTNVSCSSNQNQEPIALKRNGASCSNPDVQALPSGSYNYTCTVNESQNYTSASESIVIYVRDKIAPNWTSNRTSPASGQPYAPAKSYQFNVTWQDDVGVASVWIEHNFTGAMQNYTVSTNVSGEYNYTYPGIPAGSYIWRMYSNDSAGNLNKTPQWSFIVEKASSSVNLLLNGTDGNKAVEKLSTANITAILASGQGTLRILQNGTQIGSGASPLTLLRQYNTTASYNITAYYPATQNYTSSSESHILTIQDTTPPAITISKPANNSASSSSYNIALNVSTNEQAACKYRINTGNWTSLGTGALFISSFSIYSNAVHNITLNCTDSASNSRIAANKFTVNDITEPNITSKSPSGSSTNTNPTLTANTDEPAICYYTTVFNETNTTNMTKFSSTNSTSSTSSLSLPVGSYTYYVKCKDRLNNEMGNTTPVSFTITSPPSSGGGGGGGGGCTNECVQGALGCGYDTTKSLACEYSSSRGCWVWVEEDCDAGEECISGRCEKAICPEEWICSEWSPCINGTQTRECEDWNACGTDVFKPYIKSDCIPEYAADAPKKEERNLIDVSSQEKLMAIQEAVQSESQLIGKIKEYIKSKKVAIKQVLVKIEPSASFDKNTGNERKGSLVSLKVTAEKRKEQIEIIHVIPKEVAESASMINFIEMPEILEEDPVVRWEFTLEEAGNQKVIEYFVGSEAHIEQLTTIAVSSSGRLVEWGPVASLFGKIWQGIKWFALQIAFYKWYILLALFAISFIFLAWLSSFSKMKRKVEDTEQEEERKRKEMEERRIMKEEEKNRKKAKKENDRKTKEIPKKDESSSLKRPRGSILRKIFKKKNLDDIGKDIQKIEDELRNI